MNFRFLSLFCATMLASGVALFAQPSVTGPMPSGTVIADLMQRRQQYSDRVAEVLHWRADSVKVAEGPSADLAAVAAKLALRQDPEWCSRSVIAAMKDPGSGPFWMFPVATIAYLGREQLSLEARQAIRDAWRTTMQLRGDTENHWAMYYVSLYLMAELYPNEPAESWYSGKSSAENLAEARDYLIHWMGLTTTIGQGEFHCSHYIAEYAIPLGMLASWSHDPAMRQRGRMMLDWLFADYFASTLNGVLTGANARTDDTSVIERWNAISSFFSWLLLGNTVPPPSYGGWGVYFAAAAGSAYELPEVIYRIGIDRPEDFVQESLKRSRRRWRNSDVLTMPIYRTYYARTDYAVGSYQGGMADPIQTHVWDVTWAVPDPRGVHNTIFSVHPISSGFDMQTYFTELPDQMIKGVAKEGKPSYDMPDKLLGGSRFEQVYQHLDTVVALYDIPPGTRFPHINGFFSKDLVNVTEDASGWIFAQGGNTYLAYRPLAPYSWEPLVKFKSSWSDERIPTGDRRLVSPHLKNGTIVQAASAREFADFETFKKAIRALPLQFALEPVPTVTFRSLRGKEIRCTYGQAPQLDGKPVDYTRWKLFAGPFLNAEKNSRRLTLTHGRFERVLDFNTLTITDRVRER
jgi:hypothetical protein